MAAGQEGRGGPNANAAAPDAAAFVFLRSSEVAVPLRVKVGALRGAPTSSSSLSSPSPSSSSVAGLGAWTAGLVQGGGPGAGAKAAQLRVHCRLVGREGALGIGYRTHRVRCELRGAEAGGGGGSAVPRCDVQEWLTTCVNVRDLPREAELRFAIELLEEGAAPREVGTGRLPLFSSRLRLRTGERKVAVTPTAAGGARGGRAGPRGGKEGEAWAEMRKLDKLLKQYGRGDIPKVGWLDRLSLKQLHRLQAKSEQDALEAGQVFLTVELPSFPHAVLFHERAVIPSGAPFPAATGALATHFIFDPEVGKESPAERKAVKLQRSQEGSTTGVDRDLKPNSSERKEILAILRLPPSHKLDQAACKLLWRFRYSLREDSKALVKFLRSIHWEDVQEVQEAIKLMESWARISTSDALPLLSPDFTNAHVRAYAVKVIENEADDEELQDYLLQLVQALRYEVADPSPLAAFLTARACKNPVLANFLHWHLYVEWQDPNYGTMFASTHHRFVEELLSNPIGYEVWDSIGRQIELMAQLGAVKRELKSVKGGAVKQGKGLRELLSETGIMGELSSLQLPLPLDPTINVAGIIPEACAVLRSAMMPLKLSFRVTSRDLPSSARRASVLEDSLEDMVTSPGLVPPRKNVYDVLFKKGDDLRQDQLILQLICLMDTLLKKDGMDLRMTPYTVLATASGKDVSDATGLVQMVPDCLAISKIIEKYRDIKSFFIHEHPDPSPLRFSPKVLQNFVKSCAGYCVVTYILGIGDRHLDNLMVCSDGRLFHIDFGYILGKDPKPFPPPMRIVKEMIDAMGGYGSESYQTFQKLCCEAYNVLRKSTNLFLSLFHLMVGARIPDMIDDYEKSMLKLEERFRLDLSDEQAVQHIQQTIHDSASAVMPQVMETAHRIAAAFK